MNLNLMYFDLDHFLCQNCLDISRLFIGFKRILEVLVGSFDIHCDFELILLDVEKM